jgi:hypothetical protein
MFSSTIMERTDRFPNCNFLQYFTRTHTHTLDAFLIYFLPYCSIRLDTDYFRYY